MIRFHFSDTEFKESSAKETPAVPTNVWIAIHSRIRHGYYDRPQVEAAIIDRLLPALRSHPTDSSDPTNQ